MTKSFWVPKWSLLSGFRARFLNVQQCCGKPPRDLAQLAVTNMDHPIFHPDKAYDCLLTTRKGISVKQLMAKALHSYTIPGVRRCDIKLAFHGTTVCDRCWCNLHAVSFTTLIKYRKERLDFAELQLLQAELEGVG